MTVSFHTFGFCIIINNYIAVNNFPPSILDTLPKKYLKRALTSLLLSCFIAPPSVGKVYYTGRKPAVQLSITTSEKRHCFVRKGALVNNSITKILNFNRNALRKKWNCFFLNII